MLRGLHHVAIICSDYARAKDFYSRVLGGRIIAEHYREQRASWKCDLVLDAASGPAGAASEASLQIELFSFPSPPPRVSGPEACGLRHLALRVANMDDFLTHLARAGVAAEAVRVDEYTGARFTFFRDPDGLPIEVVEDPATR